MSAPETDMQMLTLEEIVAAALADGTSSFNGNTEALKELPTRFPVQVELQTRIFLEYHAQALKISISSLSGLILNQVVARTLEQRKT